MTPEQKAAFVNSQVACAMIEAMGMQAENASRLDQGLAPAYGDEAFVGLIDKYGIHHNAVMTTLQQ